MKKLLVVLSLLVAHISSGDEALTSSAMPRSTFRDPRGVVSKCIPPLKGEAAAILINHGVTTKNLTPEYIDHVASTLNLMDELRGKTINLFRGTEIRYVSKMDIIARQTSGPIEIGFGGMRNRGIVVHEMGHVVGNKKFDDKRTWYQLYNSIVTERCHFSEYSQVSYGGFGARNEEFAEVFAAYLIAPEMLLEGGPSCRQAHDFLRSFLFIAKDHRCDNR